MKHQLGKEPRLNATTYFAHAHLLERQGNYEGAVGNYRRAIALTPDFVTARNRLGITLNKLGQHHAATAEFREAVRLKPEYAYLHNNLGFSLFLEDQFGEAETSVRKALNLKPDFARAHTNLGLILAKQARYHEAFQEFCLAGDEADAHFNLAMLYTEAGRYADAATDLELALRLKPGMEVARQQLNDVARLVAEQEAAEAALARADSSGDSFADTTGSAGLENETTTEVDADSPQQTIAADVNNPQTNDADTEQAAENAAVGPTVAADTESQMDPTDAESPTNSTGPASGSEPSLAEIQVWPEGDGVTLPVSQQMDFYAISELYDALVQSMARGSESWRDIWCELEQHLTPQEGNPATAVADQPL